MSKKQPSVKRSLRRSKSSLLRLEPRLMFDGAAAVDAIDTLSPEDIEPNVAPPAVDETENPVIPDEVAEDFTATQAEALDRILDYLGDDEQTLERLFAIFHGNEDEPDAQWQARAEYLLEELREGTYEVVVRFLDETHMPDIHGGFAGEGPGGEPTVFINADWWNQAEPEQRLEVLVEEYGHSFDHLLNPGVDTQGDEGRILAVNALELEVNLLEQVRMHSVNDTAEIEVDGEVFTVETAVINFFTAYRVYDGIFAAEKEQNRHHFLGDEPLDIVRIEDLRASGLFSGNDVVVQLTAVDSTGQETEYFGWISRPIKDQGIIRGFYFWTDIDRFEDFDSASEDSNRDGDRDPLNNNALILTVDEAWFADIVSDPAGQVDAGDPNFNDVDQTHFEVDDNYYFVGSSSDRVDSALNALIVPNSPPVANHDVFTGDQGETVTGNVLDNDTDADADPLTVLRFEIDGVSYEIPPGDEVSVTLTQGELTLGADGELTFEPDPEFFGNLPTITYTISDGQDEASATVSIIVQFANDPPTSTDSAITVDTGVPFVFGLNNFGDYSDPNDDPLALIRINDLPAEGLLERYDSTTDTWVAVAPNDEISAADVNGGQLRYTTGVVTDVTFGFAVSDGVDFSEDAYTLSVFVNEGPPVANDITTDPAVEEGLDADGNPIGEDATGAILPIGSSSTLTQINNTAVSPVGDTVIPGLYGTLTVRADGTYTYAPNNAHPDVEALNIGDNLGESFSFTIANSQGVTDSATLFVSIDGANDAPVANPNTATLEELPAPSAEGDWGEVSGNVLVNDTDVDHIDGDIQVVIGAGDDITFDPIEVVTEAATPVSDTTYEAVQVDGSQWNSNNGIDDDPADPMTVTLDGDPVPLLDGSGDLTVYRDGTGNNAILIFNSDDTVLQYPEGTVFGVIGSDSTFSLTNVNTTLAPSDTILVDPAETGDVEVGFIVTGPGIPADTFVGAINGNEISLVDGGGDPVEVELDPVDNIELTFTDPDTPTSPVAGPGEMLITGDYGYLRIDADGDFTYTLIDPPAWGGPNDSVDEVFTYEAIDPLGATDSATLTVTLYPNGADIPDPVDPVDPVNTPPESTDSTILVQPGVPVTLTPGDFGEYSDADGDPLDSVRIITLPLEGLLEKWDGADWVPVEVDDTFTAFDLSMEQLRYTADAGATTENGYAVFGFRVSDGTDESVDSYTLTVDVQEPAIPLGEAPENTLPGPQTVPNFETLAIPGLSVTDADGDLESVTVSVANGILNVDTSGGGGAVGNGTLNITLTGTEAEINAMLATLVYTPNTGSVGSDTLRMHSVDETDRSSTDFLAIEVTADTRSLDVIGTTVNEASPWLVFEVNGAEDQPVSLELRETGVTGDLEDITGHARIGEDLLPILEYFNGTEWVSYTPDSLVNIPSGDDTLLVRVAVLQDPVSEGAETIELVARNTNGDEHTGIGTIIDDGTGDIFLGNNTTFTANNPGDTDPDGPDYPEYLDDDRPITANDIVVNEASPYAVFTIDGHDGQLVQLELIEGTARIVGSTNTEIEETEDFGADIEIFDGTDWVLYTPGDIVAFDGDTLLARTAIINDSVFEGQEAFSLGITRVSQGDVIYATASIYDDGTGDVFVESNTTGTPDDPEAEGIILSDDRTLSMNSPEVNEASDTVIFTLEGDLGQTVVLELIVENTPGNDIDLGPTPSIQIYGGVDSEGDPIWIPYDENAALPTFEDFGGTRGNIFVKVDITNEQDMVLEGPETFELRATLATQEITFDGMDILVENVLTVDKTVTGTATIFDDGRGALYTGVVDESTATAETESDPLDLDDDRPLATDNIQVSVSDPYANFEVRGEDGQIVSLSLIDGTAQQGTSIDSTIEYSFDGDTWIVYSGPFALPATGEVQVRVEVLADAEDGETFQLSAQTTSGVEALADATFTDVPAPVIDGDVTGGGDEDTTVTGTLTVENPAVLGPAPFAVTTPAVNGSASINDAGEWTYTPNADWNGTDTFTVTVTDTFGSSTDQVITITVDPVQDAFDDSATTTSGQLVIIDVLDNDSFDGAPITIESVTQPDNGSVVINPDQTITYTADPGFVGADSFTYTANTPDGTAEVATVNVTVDANPTLIGGDITGSGDEDTTITGTLTATDLDGLAAEPFAVTTPATNGVASINDAGEWTYTPDADWHGSDSFVVTVTDAFGDTTEQTINIAVDPVQNAFNDSATTTSGQSVAINVLANDDFTGTPVTVDAVTAPANGSVVINPDQTVTYTANAGFVGADSFEYTVSTPDGIAETATVSILVGANPTIIGGDVSGSGDEDTTITGTLTATDLDGLAAEPFAVTVPPNNGIAAIDSDGDWTYEPNDDWHGTDTFTVTVTDALGNENDQTVTVTVNPVQNAFDDVASTTSGQSVIIDVLANDDFTGTPVTVDAVTVPTNGTAVINPDNTITYTANAGFVGADSFEYTVSTPDGVAETATVSITVDANPTLIGGDISGSGDEDTAITGTLTADDLDGLAAEPFAVTTPATNGVASINDAGEWTYTPNADWNGSDAFTVTVTNALGDTSEQIITLTVNPVQDAFDAAASTTSGQSVVVDVLANDTFDGSPVTIESVTAPANGSVVINPDQTITYTADPGFVGADSFTYVANTPDGTAETATVSITVDANPTLIGGDISGSGDEDTTITGTLTADDLDGLPAEPFAVTTSASNGSASVDPVTGEWTYTPNADWHGSDSFVITVTNALGDTTEQTISITVDPVQNAFDDAASTTSGQSVVIDVLSNDDFTGTPVSVDAVTVPTNGIAVINPDNTITYTADPGFVGADSFEYTVSTPDGIAETATVSITVDANPTVIGGDIGGVGDEDTTITGTLTATDLDGLAAEPFAVTTPAANGTAVIADDGEWAYVPNADWHGTDAFTVTITDAFGNTVDQVITVTVDPVQNAFDDTASTTSGQSVIIDVIGNDDFTGTPVTINAVTSPANGTVTINPDQTVTYTADPGFVGADSFTYTVSTPDGVAETATVAVAVGANAITTGGDLSGTGDEDVAIEGTLTADTLNGLAAEPFSVTTPPSNGEAVIGDTGQWTYAPNDDWHGTDTFTVTVTDAFGNTVDQVITVTVDPVQNAFDDSAATSSGQSVVIDVLSNDDFTGSPVTVDAVTTPDNGSVVINPDQTVTYTADPGFVGADSFEYTVSTPDGIAETATVLITIEANPTLIGGDVSGSGDEDTTITGTLTADDLDGLATEPFAVTTAPGNGAATIDATTGEWTYIPNADWHGSDSFVVTVTDAFGNTTEQVISLTVDPVQNALDDAATTTSGGSITIDVLANDDFTGSPVTVDAVTQPANGSVVINPDQTVTYTANAGFAGPDTFTYTVSTPDGVAETATVTVMVDAATDAPVVEGDVTGAGDEDTDITGTLSVENPGALGADPYAVTTPPANGTAVINDAGEWTYTPNADWHGDDSFVVTVTDAFGNEAEQTITVTVESVQDAFDVTATTTSGQTIIIDVLSNDTFSGSPITIDAITPPDNGTAIINPDNTITYTADPGFVGENRFAYLVSTPTGIPEVANITVTVGPNVTTIGGDVSGVGDEDTAITGTLIADDLDGLAAEPFVITEAPENGTATINDAGEWVYAPNADWHGSDAFTIVVTDALGNETEQVITLTVNPVQDAFDKGVVVDSGETIVIDPLVNDSFDGVPVTLESITQPGIGSAVLNADGTVTYTSVAGFAGTVSFDYVANTPDGIAETATVTITVAATATLIDGDTTGSGMEDTTVSGTLNAENVNGLAAEPFVIGTPATNGTASINDAGDWVYVPNDDWHGVDAFTVAVTDAFGNVTEQIVTVTIEPVQNAFDKNTATTSGQSIVIDVLVNDDFTGSPVTVDAVTDPVNGSVVINPDQTVTYTADPGFVGTDVFDYTVSTPDGVAETATVTIDVGENPTLIDGDTSGTGAEDTDIGGVLTATDLDGLAAEPFAVSAPPTNGAASINDAGEWTYTPNDDWHGDDSFIVTVTDALGNETDQVITVTVEPVQNAFDNTASTTSGQSVTVDVLSNDDFTGTPVTVDAVTDPVNGSVVINPDGTVTYTADPGFVGTDVFDYTVSTPDGVAETATVTVTVDENLTVIGGDTTGSGDEDTDITGTLTATDLDGLAAEPFAVTADPANGAAIINADGEWTYTPNADWHGVDAFTVTVTDALGNETEQVITVTVASLQDAFDTTANTLGSTPVVIDVLDNDSFDGDPAFIESVTQPDNGSVVINPDQTITYTADPGFTGTDSFTYTANTPDGVAETATVTVTVDAGVTTIENGISGTGDEDTVISNTLVATNPSGLDPDPFAITVGPDNGMATINADGEWTYTPNADWHGSDSFTVTITDVFGNTLDQVIDVTVEPIQNAFNVTATTTSGQTVVIDPLANDTFTGSPVEVLGVSAPANGTMTLNADNTVTYTADPGFVGEDRFAYLVSTPTGTPEIADIIVTVDPNFAVFDGDLSGTGDEDTDITGTLTATDLDGLVAEPFAVTTPPVNGTAVIDAGTGEWTYTPNADWHGSDSFTVTATDVLGNETEQVIAITVEPVPDAFDKTTSVVSGDSVIVDPLVNDDFDGSPAVVESVTQPDNGTAVLNADGTVTYTPNPGFAGEDTFTYTANTPDGVAETATITVVVTATATTIGGDFSGDGDEDTAITGMLTADNANGLAPEPFAVTTPPANGEALISDTGEWTYLPNADWHGTDSFVVTVTDVFGDTVEQTISVVVEPVQDAFDDTASTTSGQSIVIDVLANDTFGGSPTTIEAVTDPANGSIVINPDQTVTYTADPGFVGQDTFTYTANTPDGVAETATVTVTVDPNVTSIGGDVSGTGAEDTDINGTLIADNPGGLATDPYAVTTPPSNGTATINADGEWVYTPNADWHGSDTFTVTVTDALGDTVEQTITITVDPVQNAFDNTADTTSGQDVIIDVLGNDDFTGSPVTIDAVTDPANGSVVINPDGTVTYTADTTFVGEDTFTYTVSTPDGVPETATVTVTVSANPTVIDGDTEGVGDEDTDITGTLTAENIDGLVAEPYAVTTLPDNGTAVINADGEWVYTPNADWHGDDSFVVTVTGALGNETEQVITVTVEPVQNAFDDTTDTTSGQPVVIDVLANDDFTGEPVTIDEITQADNGSVVINPDGTITYTADPGFVGEDTFTYTVSTPDGVPETATVTVTVSANPTVIDGDTSSTGAEDTVINGRLTAEDLDGLAPAPFAITTPPGNGEASISNNGNWVYLPNADWHGTDTFTVTVTDALGNETEQVITVTVEPVQNALDDTADTLGTRPVVIDVLANDDFTGSPVVIDAISQPANGTAVLNADGTITYTADRGFAGDDVFTYTVRTPTGIPETATVTVTVLPVPVTPAPVDPVTPPEPETEEAETETAPFPPMRSPGPERLDARGWEAFDIDSVVTEPHQLRVVRDIPLQEIEAGSDLRLTIPTDTFAHTDQQATLMLIAMQVDGSPLPDWMSFNSETGEITGTPPADLDGELQIRIVARDLVGRQAETMITIRPPADAPAVSDAVTPVSTGPDAQPSTLLTAPMPITANGFGVLVDTTHEWGSPHELRAYQPLPDLELSEAGRAFFYRIPAEAFLHTDLQADITLSVTVLDGDEWPDWLVFDAEAGEFSGVVPEGFEGELVLRIIARDAEGRQAETLLRIVGPSVERTADAVLEGHVELDRQLAESGVLGWQAEQEALIEQAIAAAEEVKKNRMT